MSEEKNTIIEQLKELLSSQESDYRSIIKLTNELSKLDQDYQRFFIDAKTLIHLGRDSIKDHTTALIELVKNSYDADAYNVEIGIHQEAIGLKDNSVIRIADNGFGMTKEQLFKNWLRIGFSNKRESKISALGRRRTGEKGIGRISTDRLGGLLELITKTEQDGLIGLKINWDDFDVEGRDLSDIDIEITKPTHINIPDKEGRLSISGTEIIIKNIRQSWTVDNIESLFNELSSISPPFSKAQDFNIALTNNIAPTFSKPIVSKYYEAAQIEVNTIFDGTDRVYYSIREKGKEEIIDTISLKQFYSKIKKEDAPISLNCGPLEVKLLFFLREGASVIGTDFKLSDLRSFLDNNVGVKIYRDNIAVKPYGFPGAQMGYDWLDLGEDKARNPAGVGRGDEFTVSPNQLVGAVFISRDKNTALTDSAAREGLIESESFFDMKEFVKATKRLLETQRASTYRTSEKAKKKLKHSTNQELIKIQEKLTDVNDELASMKNEIEASESSSFNPKTLIKPIERSIEKVEIVSEEVIETINVLLDWQRTINGLATIGISSAVFGHETEGAMTQFKGSASTAKKLMKRSSPDIARALIELEKSITYADKVSAWGAYALTRIQKEKRKRRNINIFRTIEHVVHELKPAFDACSISIELKGENLICSTYQMDIETILVNLLTNAFTAAMLNDGTRKVVINVKIEDQNNIQGFSFAVSDTGPGVAKEFEERIFTPLFSTKTTPTKSSKSVGTGLGLTIVKSVVEELDGNVSFNQDKKLGGAKFKVWLPKL